MAVKGPISAGSVAAYAVSSGSKGTLLDSTTTATNGTYSLSIENYSGPVLLEVTGGSYVDEATGQTVSLPTAAGSGLQAVVANVAAGEKADAQITPLTAMAAARAQAMSGGLTADNINAANEQVGTHFGGIDILATVPIDPTASNSASGASQAAINYAMVLAGFSEEAKIQGTADPFEVVSALVQDFSDGSFDGSAGATPVQLDGAAMSPQMGSANLAAAIGSFSASSANASGASASTTLDQLIAQGPPSQPPGGPDPGNPPPGNPNPSGQSYAIGGTVTGLNTSGLVLENNGGDALTITANGTFAFATTVATGGPYSVTIFTQPADSTCVVANGAGTVGSVAVGDVSVTCAATIAGALQLDSGPLTLSVQDNAAITVSLPAPAGSGGIQVSLTNSDPTLLEVPRSLVIPEGSTDGYFNVGGVAVGTASIQVAAAGLPPVQLAVTVIEKDFDIVGLPSRIGTGQTGTGTVVLRAPAPAGGATLAVVSSDNNVVAVSTATVSIAPGELQANFTFTAAAVGAAQISVIGTDNEQGTAVADITALQSTGSTTLTAGMLIDQDVAAGVISAQQGLVYKVLAAFSSPSLPSQYQGLPDDREFEDTAMSLLTEVPNLSADQQAAIAPYLSPPIYSGSAATVSSIARVLARLLRAQAASTPDPNWKVLGTQNFKIWYRTDAPSGLYTTSQAARAAKNIAANIEGAYAKLQGLLGTGLAGANSDQDQDQNGGDARYDIYVVSLGPPGWTKPYASSCAGTPSYMLASVAAAQSVKWARYIASHELMHAFQLSLPKQSGCGNDHWMFEATAEWAVDYVYPRDQTEWPAALEFFGGGSDSTLAGSGDPRRAEFRFPLDQSAGTRRMCQQGYCDYVFFYYLTHRQSGGESVIPAIFQAWSGSDAIGAINAALGGQLRTVWHQFAQKSWNDWGEPELEADFSHQDPNFPYGMSHTYETVTQDTLKVELNGQTQREFKQEIIERLGFNSVPKNTIYRLSATPLHLTFDDDSASYVVFVNPAFEAPNLDPDFRIYARAKINGQWDSGWSDWTNKDGQIWCRDKKDERIEELVVMLSNGTSSGRGLQGTDLTGITPDLFVSNVGCWQWKGKTSVTITTPQGATTLEEVQDDVTFERNPQTTTRNAAYENDDFETLAAGTAHISAGGPLAGGACSYSQNGAGPIGAGEGLLHVHLLDSALDEFSGEVSGVGQTSVSGTFIETCGGVQLTNVTEDFGVTWMTMLLHTKVSADGHTLSGTDQTQDIDPVTGEVFSTTHYAWSLTATKEE